MAAKVTDRTTMAKLVVTLVTVIATMVDGKQTTVAKDIALAAPTTEGVMDLLRPQL